MLVWVGWKTNYSLAHVTFTPKLPTHSPIPEGCLLLAGVLCLDSTYILQGLNMEATSCLWPNQEKIPIRLTKWVNYFPFGERGWGHWEGQCFSSGLQGAGSFEFWCSQLDPQDVLWLLFSHASFFFRDRFFFFLRKDILQKNHRRTLLPFIWSPLSLFNNPFPFLEIVKTKSMGIWNGFPFGKNSIFWTIWDKVGWWIMAPCETMHNAIMYPTQFFVFMCITCCLVYMERRGQQSAHDFFYSSCLPTQPTKKAALALTSSNILEHFRSSSALTTRAMIFKQAQQQLGNFYSKVSAKLGTKLAAKVVWQQNPKRARQHIVIERNHDYSFVLGTNWPKPEEFPFHSGIWNTCILPTACSLILLFCSSLQVSKELLCLEKLWDKRSLQIIHKRDDYYTCKHTH